MSALEKIDSPVRVDCRHTPRSIPAIHVPRYLTLLMETMQNPLRWIDWVYSCNAPIAFGFDATILSSALAGPVG